MEIIEKKWSRNELLEKILKEEQKNALLKEFNIDSTESDVILQAWKDKLLQG